MSGKTDVELAAALFSLMGEELPHDRQKEAEAAQRRKQMPDDRQALLSILALCGKPETPQQLYICAKAYSWLGVAYSEKAAQAIEAYLASPGWSGLPSGTVTEEGIRVSLRVRQQANLYLDLGSAYAAEENLEKAASAYMKAYDLEPYRILCAVNVSNLLVRRGKKKEAMKFLVQQKKMPYYRTQHFHDKNGQMCYNTFFRDSLNRQIEKLKKDISD